MNPKTTKTDEIFVIDDENEPEKQIIAVIPGAFKPPHRQHLDMVKHYANIADKVVIMVSPLARRTPSGKNIGFGESRAVWDTYLRDSGLSDKVEVICSPVNNATLSIHEFLQNKTNNPSMAQAGNLVIPGCSTKEADHQNRFNPNLSKYAREHVKVVPPGEHAFEAPQEAPLSARDFRASIDAGAGLERFMPDETNSEEVLSILGVEPGPEVPLEEMSSMAAGSVVGSAGNAFHNRTDEVVEEILNYLVNKGALR